MAYLWISLGGALGTIARFWLSGLVASHRIGQTFPTGTLVVNVTGSFVIGFIAALNVPEGRFYISPMVRQFLMIGVLGGYTTFSSFSLQTMNLTGEGEWLYAILNVTLSVLLCLLAVWLGQVLAQTLVR
jgi:CrcB protein